MSVAPGRPTTRGPWQGEGPVVKLFLVEVWRWTKLVLGWALLVFGPLVGGPLPGPFGIVGFAAGLILVLRNSRWARRFFIRIQRRHPAMLGPVRRALRPGANLPAILKRTWVRLWTRVRRLAPRRKNRAAEAAAPPDARDG